VKVGFWNPYLASLGGGEKYLLTIAEEAIAAGHDVSILAAERPLPADWERLGIAIDERSFEWVRATDEAELTERSRDLDLLVVTTHDVPPRSEAARSVAMIQFPSRDRRRVRDRVAGAVGATRAPAALASYDLFLCNSEFTRSHIDRRLGVEATILPPPVDVPAGEPADKAREIVTVGRFFRGWHDKRHDVLIEAMRSLGDAHLHVAGGLDANDPGAAEHLASLRAAARGLPVTFHVDAPRDELRALYGRAALYWHAAGYGADPARHPERMEHFGITTVEAMVHGAVPLSFDGGGQSEIVDDGRTGVLWTEPDELVARSRELLADEPRRAELGTAAREAARTYSRERFGERVRREVLGG
jgi:glycosyltransferase involved in cell wall biosynthesis